MKPLCVYCGITLGTTTDHVIPSCLFIPPLPVPYPKVPACAECNNKKSKNDSYLRDMLVLDLYCSEHPVAKELMKGKVIRSVEKNLSEIGRAVKTRLSRSPLYTGAGLYLGDYPSIPIEGERVNELIRTMIRGLYYDQLGKRLPDDYVFDIRRQDQIYVNEVYEIMNTLGANGPLTLGSVFGCQYLFDAKDHGISSWYLWFYGGFFLRVDTRPAKLAEAG